MKKIKIAFLLVVVSFCVYFLITFLISFVKLSPTINKAFTQLDNLENNQTIIDSVLLLRTNKEDSIVTFNLMRNDTLELHFLSCKTSSNFFLKDTVNDYILKNKAKHPKIIIFDTLSCEMDLSKKDENLYFVYKKLPFKYSKLVFPYSIILSNGTIIKSSFNAFKNE